MAKAKISKKEMMDYEFALALNLQQEYNPVGITENAVYPKDKNKENYKPRTLIDQTLEIIDPTPNIYTLFMQFNTKFFSNKLLSVEVKWSSRMTSCAGVCSFRPRSRDCVISLSAPLLKLRPRKDLVETLLHEMIHGYLFLTNNNRDRDGHGPEFCKHMHRINKEAGTNITIYHSFHDEVQLYQQHWWRCNGPCQKHPPYFGMVRRAMNRAPGPSDFWWAKHQQNCGGAYIKVREPKKPEPKSKSQKNVADKKKPTNNTAKGRPDKNLDDFFAKPKGKPNSGVMTVNGSLVTTVKPKSNGIQSSETSKNPANGSNNYIPRKNVSSIGTSGKPAAPSGLVKLGTNTNKVHGWGTGGPGSSSGSSSKLPNVSNNKDSVKPRSTLNFTGSVGGVGTGRSNLLDRFSPSISPISPNNRPPKKPATIYILDSPPPKKPKIVESTSTTVNPVLRLNNPDVTKLCNCPICNLALPNSSLNEHLDICLAGGSKATKSTKSSSFDGSSDNKRESTIITNSPSSRKSPKKSSPIKGQTNLDTFVISPEKTATKHFPCPVCNKSLDMNLLNEHLDKCLAEPKENEKKKDKTKNSVLRIEGPPAGPSGAIKSKNVVVDLTDDIAGTGEPYVCLVCNAKIRGDIALNDHLDECVQTIFNDDSFDSQNDDSSLSKPSPAEADVKDDRFPCPICMKLINENLMNQHLDTCLSGQSWD